MKASNKSQTKVVKTLLQQLKGLNLALYGKDFLRTWDKNDECILATMIVARLLRFMYEHNISPRVFDTGVELSIFRDQSTRTRHSFFTGANLLGLTVEDFDEKNPR